jgi:hypothetical protein
MTPGAGEGRRRPSFAPSLPILYKRSMRLRSDMFVSALIRRVFSAGGFAAVERKGMEEAGAIFVRRRGRDGRETLYGPAPQSLIEDGRAGDRLFELRLDGAEAAEVDLVIARELKWDGDLWVVEIEMDALGDLLVLAKA